MSTVDRAEVLVFTTVSHRREMSGAPGKTTTSVVARLELTEPQHRVMRPSRRVSVCSSECIERLEHFSKAHSSRVEYKDTEEYVSIRKQNPGLKAE